MEQYTQKDLESYFKGLNSNDIFLIMRDLDGGRVLASLIASVVKKTGLITSYSDNTKSMGLKRGYYHSLKDFTRLKMGGIKNAHLEHFLRPLAQGMIKQSTNDVHLLKLIGWTPGQHHYTADGNLNVKGRDLVNKRINELFNGMSYEDAKIT